MLCAHTVRKLKPGAFEEFKAGFGPPEDATPRGWVRFHMLRNLDDPDQVVTFGFFDGTIEDLNASQQEHGYDERVQRIASLVDEVVANGVYEVVVDRTIEGAAA